MNKPRVSVFLSPSDSLHPERMDYTRPVRFWPSRAGQAIMEGPIWRADSQSEGAASPLLPPLLPGESGRARAQVLARAENDDENYSQPEEQQQEQ